ncbi:MAG: hypothetical protein H0W01_06570 [Pseudonocardiales bacterium]|nr:hypothetical protein [Pseudonocardiales bacterium]
MTVIIILLVLAIVGIGAWFLMRERRSRALRERFGPEYERSVATTEDRRAAELELLQREKRHRELDVRPLSDEDRAGFEDRWSGVQQGFVDDPGQAVRHADSLVDDVMRARGYPVEDFEQRAADISVEHPVVVQRYREARVIAEANDAGQASTEDLRQAVTSYRALIVALLEPGPAGDDERRDDTVDTRRDDVEPETLTHDEVTDVRNTDPGDTRDMRKETRA